VRVLLPVLLLVGPGCAVDLGASHAVLHGDEYSFAGWAVAMGGDLLGDGGDDVVVGGGGLRVVSGQVRGEVYLGAEGFRVPTPDGGSRLATGDLTGDGQDDLAVGGQDTAGVWVFPGPLGPDGAEPFEVAHSSWQRMRNVAVGDFDGDGQNDLAASCGLGICVFAGPLTGELADDDATAWLTWRGLPDGELGQALVAADMDGDGADDLLVTSQREGPRGHSGSGYLFRSPLAGERLLDEADAVFRTSDRDSGFGYAAAAGFDWTGDGVADLAIGAPWRHRGDESDGWSAGTVYVFAGPLEGTRHTGDATARLDGRGGENLGQSLVGGEGEGGPFLLAGATGWGKRPSVGPLGAAFLYRGPLDGDVSIDSGVRLSTVEARSAGWAVATGGDVDGDGVGDHLVSSTRDSSVYVVRGGGLL